MNQNKDNHHNTIKKRLKFIGIILLAVGFIFMIVGLVDFFRAFANETGAPKLFWCCFVGSPLIFIGAVCSVFGFKKEIGRYVKNESVPIINEMSKEIQPGIRAIADAIKKDEILCECGEHNPPDSKFCKSCGKSLQKTCPNCHEPLDADSKFCNHCGCKIE